MDVSTTFEVDSDRDRVVEVLSKEETLVALLGEGTEIVDRSGDRLTARTPYSALGKEGVVTFNLTYQLDGNLRFEKVCDGNIWKSLIGEVCIEDHADGAEVTLSLKGRTKSLIPEFTIKGPLEDQIFEMSETLQDIIADA